MRDCPEAFLHNLWVEIIPVKTTMASYKLERSEFRRASKSHNQVIRLYCIPISPDFAFQDKF